LHGTIDENTVQIKEEFSTDLNLFFGLEEVRDLFDFNQTIYTDFCVFASDVITAPDDDTKLAISAEVTAHKAFNYLTESETALNMLYTVCRLSDEFPEEIRKNFYNSWYTFVWMFN
jgi:hypothetical protein